MDKKKLELIKVAYLYYHDNYTQQEISEIFNVSKMTVSRMLQKAREENIVKISVKLPYEINEQLQNKFINIFPLKGIVIAKNIADEDVTNLLGRIGAYTLVFYLRNNDIFGVGGSSTIAQLVKNLGQTDYKNLKVVQLMGAFEESVRPSNSFAITQTISERLGVDGYFFSAPAMVDTAEMKNMLLDNSSIFKKIKELWEICTIGIIGIGTVEKDSTLVKSNFINPKELEILKKRGAVGDILGNFFNINGKIVNDDMQSRILSISPKKLYNIDRLIAIAGGLNKVEAILGALRTGALDILITDEATAREVYKLKDSFKDLD